MRLLLGGAAMIAVAISGDSATGAAGDRSGDVQFLLGVASAETVARVRGGCASGQEPANRALLKQAGVTDLPDMVDSCVAALTRLGRDDALGYLRNPQSAAATPALAFDGGFVGAYRKGDAIPAALPSMAAVKPIAGRCLAQAEHDTELCASAGYVYGTRIANGESVPGR